MYNIWNEESIINHARLIKDLSLGEYVKMYNPNFSVANTKARNKGKGSLGQLVEEAVFNYKINSNKEADFKEVGMELKVVPLKEVKIQPKSELLCKRNGRSVKERISLSMIDYTTIVDETWNENTINSKLKKLLLMFYLYDKELDTIDRKFELINKWEPSRSDLIVIKSDWEKIVRKISDGMAHELSEGDTYFLGAATKGSDSSKRVKQPFSDIDAKPRTFSLKRPFVEDIYERLLNNEVGRHNDSNVVFVDDAVEAILSKYQNQTVECIFNSLNMQRSPAKHWLSILSKAILKTELQDQMDKDGNIKQMGIELKSICRQPSGVIKESMSFEQINYEEIVSEKWDDSIIHEKFENKKHIWVVYKALIPYTKQSDLKSDELVLEGVYIWNMPIVDMETSFRELWEDTAKKVDEGDFTHFIKIKDNQVGHIRPKAKNSSDKALFRGNEVPKKAFWLNAKYVESQIEMMKDNS